MSKCQKNFKIYWALQFIDLLSTFFAYSETLYVLSKVIDNLWLKGNE